MRVHLTSSEVASAMQVGGMRHIASLFEGWKDKYGADQGNGWQLHLEGACGELAAAKALNLYWPATLNAFGSADLGDRVQVRTRSNHQFDLIVRSSDPGDHFFVLVTGICPEYNVRGFMLAKEAKREEWLKDHGNRNAPAYFVPHSHLRPIEELAALLHSVAVA